MKKTAVNDLNLKGIHSTSEITTKESFAVYSADIGLTHRL